MPMEFPDRRLSVAPMMAWTDQHCRHLHRIFAPGARLYTEMVTAEALLRGPDDRWLQPTPAEHPVALQIGGNDPERVAAAAALGAAAGYDEINLNVGCPSDRVQQGEFGAALMANPGRVAAVARACMERMDLPFTVKCRLGIDGHDDYPFMRDFVDTVAATGVTVFIVHARIAILRGLSPRANRSIPPLCYERVARLRQERPDLTLILNGGIDNCPAALGWLDQFDGVMLGRAAYHDPEVIAAIDAALHDRPAITSDEALQAYLPYVQQQLESGTALRHLTRHLLHLFRGRPGARRYRQTLTKGSLRRDAGLEVLTQAMAHLAPAPTAQQASA